jgi:hypothetical protein
VGPIYGIERGRFTVSKSEVRVGSNDREERKKRGEQSAVIVERLQLRTMGCERFDIGIKRDAGEMILRERQDGVHIEEAIKWLRHENAKGESERLFRKLFARP